MKSFNEIIKRKNTLTFSKLRPNKKDSDKYKDVIFKSSEGEEIVLATLSLGIPYKTFNKIVDMIKKDVE